MLPTVTVSLMPNPAGEGFQLQVQYSPQELPFAVVVKMLLEAATALVDKGLGESKEEARAITLASQMPRFDLFVAPCN